MTQQEVNKLTTGQVLLSIAVNFRRICHLLLTHSTEPRIATFLDDTKIYIADLKKRKLPKRIRPTVKRFFKSEKELLGKISNPEDYLTWSSILKAKSIIV